MHTAVVDTSGHFNLGIWDTPIPSPWLQCVHCRQGLWELWSCNEPCQFQPHQPSPAQHIWCALRRLACSSLCGWQSRYPLSPDCCFYLLLINDFPLQNISIYWIRPCPTLLSIDVCRSWWCVWSWNCRSLASSLPPRDSYFLGNGDCIFCTRGKCTRPIATFTTPRLSQVLSMDSYTPISLPSHITFSQRAQH